MKPMKKKKWEGSKKDLREDKKMAKKYGYKSLKDWEKSAQDKVHDREEADKKLTKRIRKATGGK